LISKKIEILKNLKKIIERMSKNEEIKLEVEKELEEIKEKEIELGAKYEQLFLNFIEKIEQWVNDGYYYLYAENF
jgi:hypothetical protein